MNPVATTSKPPKPQRLHPYDRRYARKKAKVNTKGIYPGAIKDAFFKLNPKHAVKNPVMFLVWVSTLVTLAVTIEPELFGPVSSQNPRLLNGLMALVLFLTVWFTNFAEALAQARGKAQADALRSTKSETIAKKLFSDGTIAEVSSSSLRRGDTVYLSAGDIIPADGEVIMGAASVDESAITGESAPVLKETGSDVSSSVIGGTRIISDELIVRITADPGKGFIDRMIALVEKTEHSKTANEIVLTVLLAALSLIFLLVVATIPPFANYIGSPVSVPILVALLVVLLPKTVGGLLAAIGIAAMDRVAQFNIIATSERAIENCGDVNTLVLDKTGTITFGNRLAEGFIPIDGRSLEQIASVALAASVFDETPEGKSIVRASQKLGAKIDFDLNKAEGIEFSARTRISGTNLPNGRQARKGAVDAIKGFVRSRNGHVSSQLDTVYEMISQQGGTPLAVCLDNEIYGVIYLKDIVKPGMRDRFEQLRRIGVRSIMVTGDNHITAGAIAKEAGVDNFIAQATPEDKVAIIQQEQTQGKIVAMTGDGTNDAPALMQADVGVAMNTGTPTAKEVADIVDLDSDPTKFVDLVTIAKQLLITRAALTIFSITNDLAKYFAIIPVLFTAANLQGLNIMRLTSTNSAVLSTLIYDALIIPALIPLALKGVKFRPLASQQLLQRHILIYGLGGIIVPFFGIKIIDLVITVVGLA
jgi:K+-transporting ATPase ATPase B chain